MNVPRVAPQLCLALLLLALPARAELFLASFSGNRVLRYNETNGAFLSVFVAANSGGLSLPHGVAFGPDGNFYVASAGTDEVLRYNGTNGAFLNAFIPSTSGLDYPVWLEFRPDGFLYVSSQLNNSVLRFNATNGAFAGIFVTNGSGGLNGPSGMTWGTDGLLYVVGRFGNHVMKYDGTNGAFLGIFAQDGPLVQPFGIKVGPDGHFYVASGNGNRIARFHGTTGASLGDFVPAGVGALSLPIDLSFGPNGDLYVASFNNNKVARFNGATGAYINDFVASGGGGMAGPNFMAFRPAQRFSPSIPGIGPVGPIEQRHLGMQFTEGPAADANGNVFFTDVQASRIYKSDTRGLLSVFYPNSSACNGLMFDQSGRLIACQRDLRRMIAIDVVTTNVTPLATGFGAGQFVGPNDLVVDSIGGVYFTDPNFGAGQNGYTQSVYYASAAGVVSQIASNLSRPNGVLLSTDERTLYVVLSGSARLMSYPVLSPGVIGPATTNAIPQSGDGMTLDTQGNLYLCQPGANLILVRAPSGATLGTIPIPESPANCAFGGKDMKTLFVTARTSLYACRMEATGHRYAWNPANYASFQRKFFGTTNAPNSGVTNDPDGDGAINQLEYLTRTHPLCPGDQWRIGLARLGDLARVSFLQLAGRGFEVEFSSTVGAGASWMALSVPGNPPAISSTNRLAVIDDTIGTTNRFYRVRVFEPQ